MGTFEGFRHDALFWRKLASLGATRGPEWWVRYSPPAFGLAAAVAVPEARRSVIRNLRRVHGERSPAREAIDVARTFTTFANCLAEILAQSGPRATNPEALIIGERNIRNALAMEKGVVFVTAHTAGWELVGNLLAVHQNLSFMMVMQEERDDEARILQDRARTAFGARIIHAGRDPLATLPMLQHLRKRGVLAIQMDRTYPQMRTREVSLFGRPAKLPEGALRLAQVSGAPVVPVFAARQGHHRYIVKVFPPILVGRKAQEPELDSAAQSVADAMTSFLTAYPTHWFHFERP